MNEIQGPSAPPAAVPAEPSPQTCIRVAREAAALAAAADDQALNAVIRSTSRTEARLEQVMHAVHKEACEAQRFADWAQSWEADGVAQYVLARYADKAVEAAMRAQAAARVEVTAAALRAKLQRRLTADERAERESARRREEARREAEERAATGMDSDNRRAASMNWYYAEEYVSLLGWTAGHLRVMEAADSGRLYVRDGQIRQARQAGQWDGGRRVSRDRTQALYAARFLIRTQQVDGIRVVTLSPMGRVALELVRLHPAGLYETDQAAYDARYARAARWGMSSDAKKAAARRLPPLDSVALRLYRRPVTLAEQEARAQQEAADQWEDEGGYCRGVEAPRATAEPAPPPAAAPEPGPQLARPEPGVRTVTRRPQHTVTGPERVHPARPVAARPMTARDSQPWETRPPKAVGRPRRERRQKKEQLALF